MLKVPTGACSPDTSSGSFNNYNSYWVDSSGNVTEHSGSHVDIVYYSYGSPGYDNSTLGYRINSIGDAGFDGFGNVGAYSYGKIRSPYTDFGNYAVLVTPDGDVSYYNSGVYNDSYGVMKYSYVFPSKC